MDWLVRKVASGKWAVKPELRSDGIAADAVTSDLKTTENALSLWLCGTVNGGPDPKEIVWALGSTCRRLDPIKLCCFRKSDLEERGFDIRESEGHTRIASLKPLHRDLVKLDLTKLSSLASLIANCVRTEENYCSFSKSEVLDLLVKAVKEKVLSLDDLAENQEKLRARLNKALEAE